MLAAAAIAVTGSGCGDSASGAAGNSAPGGGVTAPNDAPSAAQRAQSIRSATCGDWRTESHAQRKRLVGLLGGFTGGAINGSAGDNSAHGGVLDPDKAEAYLTAYCKQKVATHFKIYKLYGRAAGFGAGGY